MGVVPEISSFKDEICVFYCRGFSLAQDKDYGLRSRRRIEVQNKTKNEI